jgi:hypothetical protein
MQEILSQTYFGKILQSWAIGLVIIVLSVMLGKVAYWMSSRFIRIHSPKSNPAG